MADSSPRNRAPALIEPRELVVIEDEPPPPFDHHGFDPNDFEWRPVPRRPRADGWTPEVQRRFIETLADTGMVSAAAQAVDMSTRSAYRLRRAPGSESFARAWDVALDAAADTLADIVFARAIEGVDEPVFDRDGCRIGSKQRYNDRLAMFLLRAYRPDRFRHAHESVRQPGEAPPPPAIPLAQAVAALGPVTPEAPHLLSSPERLEDLVDMALDTADFEQRHPPDERERYVRPRVEPNHPAATARGIDRRTRAMERERRRAADYDESGACRE
jgi:hypothetical protein